MSLETVCRLLRVLTKRPTRYDFFTVRGNYGGIVFSVAAVFPVNAITHEQLHEEMLHELDNERSPLHIKVTG